MLSLDLFATQFEKELREGAVDDLEYRRMNDLREKMEMLMQAYKKADTDEVKTAIMKRYKEYKAEREGYMKVREQQVPSKQDPFAYVKSEPKGIGDIQDPRQKMAQLAQQSKKGALANVGAGLKAFIKGEPEPMGEQQQVSPRALGVANFQRLVKANMGNLPSVNFEFIRPEENFKLDARGLDLISDYYDGLETDQAKNYFIYRVLPSGEETLKILKQLGWSPTAGQQQSLPGIPTQGELPLQEKKKSNSDDLEAGDVKVARELQKLRAQYPAAKSDVEAVARAEIDSTERSQQQLAAIRGANEKQDALLKQLVALDQEQGREIDGLDKENNSLEQRLAQVQATNDRLQQAIGKMTGTKKAASAAKSTSTDVAQGGIIDVGAPMVSEPMSTSRAKAQPTTSSAMDYTVQQLGGFSNKPLASLRPVKDIGKDASNDPKQQTQKVSGSDIEEHGGGIGPKKHWQSMMPEGQPQELIHRYLAIDAENDVDAVRAAIQAISRDPALGANSKSRLLGQIGMIIRRHRLPIGRSYYQFMQQYMEAVELDRARVAGYPNDPATAKHRLDTAKAILSNPASDADSRREAAAIVAKLDKKVVAETVANVKAGMAEIYRRLAPKIERHRDSFLAGQLYDELENYAELHGAEGEFKRMMATARNSAHMEYDTNPGGFQNWFWFLPFEDEQLDEISRRDFLKGVGATAGAVALGAPKGAQAQEVAKWANYASKLAVNSVMRIHSDTGYDLRNWITQNVSIWVSNYCDYTNSYNAKNVIDYCNETALEASGLKDLDIIRQLFFANFKNKVSDFLTSYRAAILEKTKEFDRVVQQQKQQQQQQQNLHPIFTKPYAELNLVLSYYHFAKELDQSKVPVIQAELSKYIKATNEKDLVNSGYRQIESALENIKNSDPNRYKELSRSFLAHGPQDLERLKKLTAKKEPEFKEEVNEAATDDIKNRMSKLEALALAANRAGDDAKCKMYQQKIQSLKQKLSKSMAEGWSDQGNPTAYSVYIDGREWRAYKSDDHARAVAEKVRANLKRQGRDQTVTIAPSKAKRVQENISKEPRTARERDDMIDKIRRMMTQDRNPANLQIMKKDIEILQTKYRDLKEDSGSGEAVEMAIMRRMLVAHTDLIVEFGLDKVVAAIEEVAYDVGDVDEIGSSDVSGWVRQVERVLGVEV
jgi:hypothetical protein